MTEEIGRLLVVDDDESKRYSISRVLRSEGFSIVEACDGEGALLLAKEIPDLILLDVKLPDINGLEICRRIKADPLTAHIPVMHISGTFVSPEHRVRGLDSGADAYLSDTASAGELVATVRSLLRARKAEQAAIESEQRYRTLIEAVPQLVWSCLPDGECDFINARWIEYTGVPAEQHLGSGWLQVLHPADRPAVTRAWGNAVQGFAPYDVEFRIRRHDGVYRWFQTRGVPLRDEANRVVKWFGTSTDIHEQKEAAVERSSLLAREKAAREEAEMANRLKDDFLATLSHELRTPLMAILGWAELLQFDDVSDADFEEGLKTIQRNARAQAQLIDDLLDVSRIISGKMRLDVQPIDLLAVVAAAVESVQTAADGKEIQLVQRLDPTAANAMGDPTRLQQVVWNLLSNAIKFTPKGGRVTVQISRVSSHVDIVVSDTGQGIAAEFLPHVFERFRQQDASSRRAQGGLGLGLAIARNIVELHGGTMSAQSAGVNQGSTFTASLPMVAVAQVPSALPQPSERTPRLPLLEYSTLPDLTGVNVIVVDDEVDARDLLAKALQQRGALVTKASNVDDALLAIENTRPDILISDIGMPEQDGYDLIRRLRQKEAGDRRLPALALTAFARGEDRQRALRAGFQAHLPKPVIPTELVTIVASLITRPT